jgi:ribosomal protein L12E/L44/L45/RPP1/RPP2
VVKVLSPAERIDEIARMLGGVDITEQARAHAEEMLGVAQTARSAATAPGSPARAPKKRAKGG